MKISLHASLLYKFLKQQGVFQDYIINVCKRHKCDVTKKNIETILRTCNGIGDAFIWEDTKEGRDFWSNLNEKWHDYEWVETRRNKTEL